MSTFETLENMHQNSSLLPLENSHNDFSEPFDLWHKMDFKSYDFKFTSPKSHKKDP
jgi:hypothetical protein